MLRVKGFIDERKSSLVGLLTRKEHHFLNCYNLRSGQACVSRSRTPPLLFSTCAGAVFTKANLLCIVVSGLPVVPPKQKDFEIPNPCAVGNRYAW